MASGNTDRTSIEELIAKLGHKDGMTRRHAREKLVDMGGDTTPHLLPLLERRRDKVLRWEAAKALSALADPASAPALVSALTDEDPDVRWLAAEGLAALGRPALRLLARALIDDCDRPNLREGVHHVLHNLHDHELRKTTTPLYDVLSGIESSADVIIAAERVLEELG